MDNTQYNKALVTGGAGFIGSHIVEKLLQRDIETIVLDDLSIGKKENVPETAELIIGDVCNPEIVKKSLSGVDVVFHLAARVSIRDSFRSFIEDAQTNVMGTVNLLKHIEESSVKKFIYASSMAVYGDADDLPMQVKNMFNAFVNTMKLHMLFSGILTPMARNRP
ncbi:MAG: NAD-dependent epimerase/dehydratase family protein [Deltaproteobacteria bacterium]|nr:NAD-dependent epimerase/dehydratase family protein [Deltaproteobacteria bacterium]